MEEAQCIVAMAKVLQMENESFKIITPYDAQRALIEDLLQEAELHFANKCFNVDSFQGTFFKENFLSLLKSSAGNEDEIIILSLVRSSELGFLADYRRTNVMLTRCKKTLFVCSSKAFLLKGPGANSLVGRMAASFGDAIWIELEDIAQSNF